MQFEYPFLKMAAATAKYYFRFRICWCHCLQKVKVYHQTFRPDISYAFLKSISKPNFVDISQLTKFLQEVRTVNETSWVVPWLTQTNPRWRWPPSLILEKISITPDWIKISAPNFMGRCTKAEMTTDQKLKPEVNSRDVIKWSSEAYVCQSQWL